MLEKDVGGRPPHEPTEQSIKQVQELAGMGCSHREIASVMGIDEKTLRKYYPEHIETGVDLGKSRLRRAQLKNALEGNATMQVWLGKTWLEQRETIQHAGGGGGPVQFEDVTEDDGGRDAARKLLLALTQAVANSGAAGEE